MAQAETKTDSKQVFVQLTMPLEDARKVVWQGRGTRAPMGDLLDSKQIDRGDLVWAVDVGYDPQFREAARTLLAHSIGKPDTLRFGPAVIEGSRYLEEQESENILKVAVMIGTFWGMTVMAVAWIIQQVFSSQILFHIISFVLGLLLVGGFTWKFYGQRYLENYRTFHVGREGEDEVVDRLRTALDNRWTIFRNLVLPNRKDDIDIVLVGPDGVWVIEVKTTQSTLRVEGKNWQKQARGRWVPADDNPSVKITKKALGLNDYLNRQGFDRYVERAVALATPQPIKNFETSEIPIWLFANIEDKVVSLKTLKPVTQEENAKIVQLLRDITTKQIAIEKVIYG